MYDLPVCLVTREERQAGADAAGKPGEALGLRGRQPGQRDTGHKGTQYTRYTIWGLNTKKP